MSQKQRKRAKSYGSQVQQVEDFKLRRDEPRKFEGEDFGISSFAQLRDQTDPQDPHINAYELEDPIVDKQLPFNDKGDDTKQAIANNDLKDKIRELPDYSDTILSEQNFRRLMGYSGPFPKVVDLDTADDYVEFVKVANANMLEQENEFETSKVEYSKDDALETDY